MPHIDLLLLNPKVSKKFMSSTDARIKRAKIKSKQKTKNDKSPLETTVEEYYIVDIMGRRTRLST